MRRARSLVLALAALVAIGGAAAPAGAAAVSSGADGCVPTADPDWSAARDWDEAILDAIRRSIPNPPVHARNLFHLSVAMWDAWAAYDPVADGYLVTEKATAEDVAAARDTAISYAAYRILVERYRFSAGADVTLPELDGVMASRCHDPSVTTTDGDSPAALGNRIAAAVLAWGLTDGSNEETGYIDPTYAPVNKPLIVKVPGARLRDPDRWQPLALDAQKSQNGIAIPDKVQSALAPQWGHVRGFALPPSDDGLPIDPGTPPSIRDPKTHDAYIASAVMIIRRSAQLDPTDGVMIDVSPRSIGNNHLGTYDGRGWSVNPVTNEPYEPVMVPRGDWTRALAEYWADGPRSETPPGHWNLIMNQVGDSPGFVHRIGADGPVVDRLEWDVTGYFALNGALHDAAIAAWGAKRHYDSVRPISMVRWLAANGQSSRPDLPSYSRDGLPLIDGLIELITPESSAPGHRHAGLARHVGKIAIKAWRGAPDDPETQASGVGWILGSRWTPYAEATFVTPSFPGYVSGHSTFSRAAAEVMTRLTGSAFFPGGLFRWTTPVDGLRIEAGPTADVPIEAASYYDAADLAAVSRLYSGFHIPADDLDGRRAGSLCGIDAWRLASTYLDGSART